MRTQTTLENTDYELATRDFFYFCELLDRYKVTNRHLMLTDLPPRHGKTRILNEMIGRDDRA